MKCSNCHTHLPEFSRFQKRVCPNCGNPVSIVKPVNRHQPVPRKSAPANEQVILAQAASRYMDHAIWCTFGSLLFLSGFVISTLASTLLELNVAIFGAVFLVVVGFLFSTPILPLLGVSILKKHTLKQQLCTSTSAHKKYLLKNLGCPSLGRFFGALALGFFTALLLTTSFHGIFTKIHYNRYSDSFATVEATITDIAEWEDSDGDTHYDVYICYSYGEKQYKTEYSKYSSSMYEGQTISVKIDPENPDELPTDGVSQIVASLIGLIILGSVLYFAVIKPLLERRMQ